ncbi:GNAT family N-acetyltransferase [Candidatus Binatus sp.]|uniref:GNAT family N-acetyltransferase n=1 Tax=Candidatus Binatus sp. TaxID=2811406 RepID=UPI003C56157A
MQGKLVRLRAYEKSDADALFRWFSDEEVTRWLEPPAFRSRAHQEKFIELAQASSDDAKYFAIETLDGKLVGDCGLRFIDWKSRKAEFFITIGEKQFWGKGLGTDALRTVIRLAFDKMNLNRLWLTVLVDNPRAVRCYEKCGFVREGLMRQESYVDGKYRDVLLMALLREDYDRTRGA